MDEKHKARKREAQKATGMTHNCSTSQELKQKNDAREDEEKTTRWKQESRKAEKEADNNRRMMKETRLEQKKIEEEKEVQNQDH